MRMRAGSVAFLNPRPDRNGQVGHGTRKIPDLGIALGLGPGDLGLGLGALSLGPCALEPWGLSFGRCALGLRPGAFGRGPWSLGPWGLEPWTWGMGPWV